MEYYWNITTAKANDVVNMILSETAVKKSQNRQILSKILTNIRCLTRQSLSLRTSWSNKSASEVNSNFHRMILIRCEDNEMRSNCLNRRTEKYTIPEIQNEMTWDNGTWGPS